MRHIVGIVASMVVTWALLVPAPAQAGYHKCPGWIPYAGYGGLRFWHGTEAQATPCRAAKALVREATWRWSRRSGHANVSRTIYLQADIGGPTYRCSFAWSPAPLLYHYVNHATCKAPGGKRIRFRSTPAGD